MFCVACELEPLSCGVSLSVWLCVWIEVYVCFVLLCIVSPNRRSMPNNVLDAPLVRYVSLNV